MSLAIDTLELLRGDPVSLESVSSISKCINALPANSYINHIGLMISRKPEVLKINITKLNLNQLVALLAKIGLKDETMQIEDALHEFDPFIDYLALAIEISEEIKPRIGVELRLNDGFLSLSSQHKWHTFLDYLVKKKLCTDEKKNGLMEWTGRSREIYDPELCSFYIYRYINLLKMVFEPGKSAIMKGYFSFIIQPIRNS